MAAPGAQALPPRNGRIARPLLISVDGQGALVLLHSRASDQGAIKVLDRPARATIGVDLATLLLPLWARSLAPLPRKAHLSPEGTLKPTFTFGAGN